MGAPETGRGSANAQLGQTAHACWRRRKTEAAPTIGAAHIAVLLSKALDFPSSLASAAVTLLDSATVTDHLKEKPRYALGFALLRLDSGSFAPQIEGSRSDKGGTQGSRAGAIVKWRSNMTGH